MSVSERHLMKEIAKIHLTSTWIEDLSMSEEKMRQNVGQCWIWSLMAQTVKCLPAMWETWVRSLGREDPLEKEMATHSSTLAWKIPWMEEHGRLQSMGSQRVGHDWVTSLTHSLKLKGRYERHQGKHQRCPEEHHPGSALSGNNSYKSPAWTGQTRPTNHRPFHLGNIFDRELRVSTHPSYLSKSGEI